MWFKKHKWKVIAVLAVLAILAAAFLLGSGAPGQNSRPVESPAASESPRQEAPAESPAESVRPVETGVPEQSPAPSESMQPVESPEPSKSAGPELSPTPSPTQTLEPSAAPEPAGLSCTLSISCATILNNMDMLDPAKVELVPASGWILGPVTVTFTEGETVFDVLQRTLRDYGIHMESKTTPLYGSVYIEGIANLYEFDCGGQSGWMYQVNGWFPNYGCSKYTLCDGDSIQWLYTCDLGYDVGGGYAAGNRE